ncbi:MAG: hypothetical protein ACI92E_001966 [Oceanicoccus sp.]
MSSSFLEIVQLADGEVVLQRVDDDSEPLVSIRFSDESRTFIDEAKLDVAKAMIHAGLEVVAQISRGESDRVESQEDKSLEGLSVSSKDRVIH